MDGSFNRRYVAGALELADRHREALVGAYRASRPSGPQTRLAQGLAGASAEELNEIEVVSGGTGLRWESLDADLGVDALVRGLFGSPPWAALAELIAARKGQPPPEWSAGIGALPEPFFMLAAAETL